MDNEDSPIRVERIDYLHECSAVAATPNEPLSIANVPGKWRFREPHHVLGFLDGNAVLRRMIQVPIVPAKFVQH
jgi:hypothetical protein